MMLGVVLFLIILSVFVAVGIVDAAASIEEQIQKNQKRNAESW